MIRQCTSTLHGLNRAINSKKYCKGRMQKDMRKFLSEKIDKVTIEFNAYGVTNEKAFFGSHYKKL